MRLGTAFRSLRGAMGMWVGRRGYSQVRLPPRPRYSAGNWRTYPLNLEAKASYRGPLDNHGVFLHHNIYDGRFVYYPITIAIYALAKYQRWRRSGSEDDRRSFMVQAAWFVKNAREQAGGLLWTTDVVNPTYEMKPGWSSAMAQGMILSVLLRAMDVARSFPGQDLIRRAVPPFFEDIERGGLRSDLNGHPFYEEYPSQPASHVLNGAVAALMGLYEVWKVIYDPTAKAAWEQGIEGLIHTVEAFDTGYWTCYDLFSEHERNLASLYYHEVHIDHMQYLGAITGVPVFSRLESRWRAQRANPLCVVRSQAEKCVWKMRTLLLQ